MRRIMLTLVAALGALTLGAVAAGAVENCRTGDSALCVSDPNCHWDFQRRGCYEGPPAQEDACTSHSHVETCDADLTLGCKWDAAGKQCKSAK